MKHMQIISKKERRHLVRGHLLYLAYHKVAKSLYSASLYY